MAKQTPIPQNPIEESFVWRDWFQRLSDRVFGSAASLNVPIEPEYGGTGITTYNTGDIIYCNSTDNLTRLAAPGATSVLQMTALGVPSWTTAGAGTVTSVAVSGGTTGLTTTGGPITSSGTITLDGTLEVDNGGTGATTASDARTNLGLAYGPAFSAYPGTTQTISSGGTLVKVNFGTEEFDTNNNFSSSRFTPTVAGYYQVNSTIRLDGGGPGTGECMIVVFKNGSEAKRGWNSEGTSFANNFFSLSVSAVVYCNGSTDYLEIYAQQVSGGSRNTSPYANISYFQAFLARPA
jgi:hypothetical protein